MPARFGNRIALCLTAAVLVLPAACSRDDNGQEEPTVIEERQIVVATATVVQLQTPRTTGLEYTVQDGDTISGISEMFDVTQDDIARANNLADLDSIQPGQVLIIPPPSDATP